MVFRDGDMTIEPVEEAVRRALAEGCVGDAAAILRAAESAPPLIRTPFGVGPETYEPPPVEAQLRALCYDMASLEAGQAALAADVAHQAAEIAQLIIALDALRRRVERLERRGWRRRGRAS